MMVLCICWAVVAEPVYEGFDYAPGAKLHDIGSQATGWGGPWVSIHEPSANYASIDAASATVAPLEVAGGKAMGPSLTAARHYRPLVPALGGHAGGELWISVVMGDDDTLASTVFAVTNSGYGFDTTGAMPLRDRLFGVRISGRDNSRAFRLDTYEENSTWISPSEDGFGGGAVRWTPGPHLVLVRIRPGAEQSVVNAWIDPPGMFDLGPADLWLEGAGNGAVRLDGVVWSVDYEHAIPNTAILDEIRIGHSLREVMPGFPDTRDATAYAHHGRGEGTNATHGMIDGARYFDGGRDFVDCGAIGSLERMTLTAWLWRRRSSAAETFASQHDGTVGWTAGFDGAGGARFDTDAGAVYAPSTVDSAAWHYLACVVDSHALRLYLDGDLVADTVVQPPVVPATVPLFLGKWLDGLHLHGVLDEVRVSDVARTPIWIKLSYETQRHDQRVAQIPLNKPYVPAVTVTPTRDVVIRVEAPGSADGVQFERRAVVPESVWLPVQLVEIADGLYTDTTAECESEYAYRARFLSGSTVSPWSDDVSVVTGRCYETSELIEIVSRVSVGPGRPLHGAGIDVTVRLYSALRGGEVVLDTTMTTSCNYGWVTLVLGQEHDMRALVERYPTLAVELEVEGVTQPRRPLAAYGMNSLISPRRFAGQGDPTGLLNHPVGSLYLDTDTRMLYFKYGAMIGDWEPVR